MSGLYNAPPWSDNSFVYSITTIILFRFIYLFIAQTEELFVFNSVRDPFTGKVTGFSKTLSHSYGEVDSKEEDGHSTGDNHERIIPFLISLVCSPFQVILITPLLGLLLF